MASGRGHTIGSEEVTEEFWIGDPSAGPHAVLQDAMTNLPPGAVMKSIIGGITSGQNQIKVAFGLDSDALKSTFSVQDAVVAKLPTWDAEVNEKLIDPIPTFVKLHAGGPGTGSAHIIHRGKVFRVTKNEIGDRLGNVRDLQKGGYAVSYRGSLSKPVVFKREFKTISTSLLFIAFYHDLLAVANACQAVGFTVVESGLLEVASDLRQDKQVEPIRLSNLATLCQLGMLSPYLDSLFMTASVFQLVTPGAPPVNQVVTFNQVALPKRVVPEKTERPFQVHRVEATDRFLVTYRAWQDQLQVALESGVETEETPAVTGNCSGIRVVTFKNGFKAVRKVMSKHDCLDHECVASLVGNALDPGRAHVIVPYALRTAPNTVYLELLDGVASKLYTYNAVLEDGDCNCCSVPKRMARHDLISRGGAIFMSALDLVIGNSDRHCDNLMLHDDGRWRLIDHAYSLDLGKFKDLDQLDVRELRRDIDDQTLTEWHARVIELTEAIRDVTVVRRTDLAVQVADRILTYRTYQ